MPRYFIDIDNGNARTRDEDGAEYADADEAGKEALVALPDLARGLKPDSDQRLIVSRVRDEEGRVVYQATLSLVGEWLV